MSARRLGLAGLLALSACAGGGKPADFPSEWEREHERLLVAPVQEATPATPALPSEANLLPFEVSAARSFRYYVDKASISVAGGRVRYTVLARSPNGVDNISFEAIDCKQNEFRSYARAGRTGGWTERPSPWRAIESPLNAVQSVLEWQYFCPHGIPVADAAEAVSALRAGGHPNAKPSLVWPPR